MPWPRAAADLIALLAPDDLPGVPFRLSGRTMVHDAGRFLHYMKQCIRLGSECHEVRQDIADLARVVKRVDHAEASHVPTPVEIINPQNQGD